MKTSPCPEGKEVEPWRYDKGLDKVSVSDLVKDKVKPDTPEDTQQNRMWVIVNQQTKERIQFI